MFKTNGLLMPNTGTTVLTLEATTREKAINIGKPEPYGINTICKEHGIDFDKEKNNMLIVGDNIGVEIKLGKNIGIDSLLVLSGSTNKEMLDAELRKPDNERVVPTYVLPYLTYKS